MSAEIKKEIQLEIAHVLFIDTVGYSKLSINEQHAAVQFLNRRVLLVNRKLRVANGVDEQDMGDFELDLFLNLRRHVLMRVASRPEAIIEVLPCPVEEINIENHTSRR